MSTAGVLGIALPKAPTRTSSKIAPAWYAPVGALMIAICGASSLSAFPLDDIWHRVFGQDVTLWALHLYADRGQPEHPVGQADVAARTLSSAAAQSAA